MLVSGMVGTDTPAVIQTSAQASTSSISSTVTVVDTDNVEATDTKKKALDRNAELESKVRLFFADTPIMAEVLKCESRFRQFNADGTVMRGIANNKDVGLAQVNEFYHLKRAKKLGYNIHTVEGNLAYAKLLYQEEGTDPWISSAPCWKKSEVAKAMSSKPRKILADNL